MSKSCYRRTVLRTIAGGAIASTVLGQSSAGRLTATTDNLLWSELDAQFPTVVDGIVYAGNNSPSQPPIRALDAETGDVEWEADGEFRVAQPPQVVDGRVFYTSTRDHIRALDADSGDTLWTYPIESSGPSPTVIDETVYAPENVNLYALDVESGDEKWVFEAEDDFDFIEAPPVVVEDTIYVGNDNGMFWALDREDGTIEWQRQLGARTNHAASVVDGVVYVGSYQGPAGHMDDTAAVFALDADNGEELWEFPLPGTRIRDAVTVYEDTVFADSGDYLYAIDAETSEERWRFNHEVDEEETRFSSPTVADGVVYLLGSDRTLYGIDIDNGEEVLRFEHEDRFEEERFFLDHPIVVNGVLYFSVHERIGGSELKALEVEGDGSSVDSRVLQGTLSHHGEWTGDPSPLSFGLSNVGENVPENPRNEALDEEAGIGVDPDEEDDADDSSDDDDGEAADDDDGEAADDDDATGDGTSDDQDDETDQADDDADDDGPGFGIGAGIAGIGGAAYIVKRRLDPTDRQV